MQSIRSRLLIGLIKKRHLFQLKLKQEVIDEAFSVQAFRDKIDAAAMKYTRIPDEVCHEMVDIDGMHAEWLIPNEAPKEKVILYIHGGGFISGSSLTHRMHVLRFVKGTGIKALLFDYRLAPEHPYPAALEDSLSAYKWLLDKGFDPKNIVIAGESAGGSLTLASSVALRDQGIPLPKALVSVSPCTDLTCSAESFVTNAKRDIAPMNSWYIWTGYYVGETNPALPWLSPLNADLEGLPPMLLYVGSAEIHLDDTRNFAMKAKKAGVDVEFKIWKGMVHAFPLLPPLFPEGKEAMKGINDYICKQLDNKSLS